jgi:hypothetical protein
VSGSRWRGPATQAERIGPFGPGNRLPTRPPAGPRPMPARAIRVASNCLANTFSHMNTLPDVAVLPWARQLLTSPRMTGSGSRDRIKSILRILSSAPNRNEPRFEGSRIPDDPDGPVPRPGVPGRARATGWRSEASCPGRDEMTSWPRPSPDGTDGTTSSRVAVGSTRAKNAPGRQQHEADDPGNRETRSDYRAL